MFSVRQLYDLQLLDWDIQSHEQDLAETNSKLADDSARVAAKKRLDGLEARLGELGPARRTAEAAVEETEQNRGPRGTFRGQPAGFRVFKALPQDPNQSLEPVS